MNTSVFMEDLKNISCSGQIPWEQFHGSTIFVTGATGLIGQTLVNGLLYRNQFHDSNISILALVRDMEKAEALFRHFPRENLRLIHGTVENLPAMDMPIDYIVHCACPTASQYFLNHPVETTGTILDGTRNILELAREKKVRQFVFLSSMEVYGTVHSEQLLREDTLGDVDLMSPRSCYPLGKRMAENLCCSYHVQYGVPAVILRLAQTFGPGVSREDSRVFAYISRCALEGVDVALSASGGKKNMYLYTADAVTAILVLLAKGCPAVAYNAANPETYCSIKEMAQAVSDTFCDGKIGVKTHVGAVDVAAFPPDTFLRLDTTKLQSLGWKPTVDLMEMYRRMINCFSM